MSNKIVFCPRCGYQNNRSHKYCFGCGYELPLTTDFSSSTTYTATTKEPPQQRKEQQILFPPPLKSHLAAFVLTLFLGPFGVFYSSLEGGIILSIIPFLLIVDIGLEKFVLLIAGLAVIGITQIFIFLYWLICIIWALVAVSIDNNKLLKRYYRN